MTNLYFIGGAKGVGKTSLIQKVSVQTGLPILNTGSIYQYAKACNLDPEDEIVSSIVHFRRGLLDTHYVGYHGEDIVQGLRDESITRISHEVEHIKFVLIDLDENELLRRRINDSNKHRKNNYPHLKQELLQSRICFYSYCRQLNQEGLIVINNDLNESSLVLTRYVYNGREANQTICHS